MRRHVPLLVGIVLGVVAVGAALPAVVDADDPRAVVATTENRLGMSAPVDEREEGPGAPGVVQTGIAATTVEVAGSEPPVRQASGSVPGGTAARSATDRGVTAEEIRLGFLLIDVTGGDRVGFTVGISVEQQTRAIQAFIDDLNGRGGIHGRRVKGFYAPVNLLDNDAGRKACLALTEDHEVFAAIGRLMRSDAECITREHETFFLNNVESAPDGMFRDSGGLLVNMYSRGSRMAANWVAALDELRYLDGRKVGIVTDEKEDPGAETAQTLKSVLEAAGHPVVRISRLSASLEAASSQIPVEVSQQRSAGATAIMFMANPLPDTQFAQQAEAQGWFPRYAVTDWASHAGDTSNSNMPASFDGTLAMTAAPVGRGTTAQPGWPEPDPAIACRDVYEQRSGTKLAARGTNEYSLTMVYCDSIRIFEQLATVTGPELTRARLRVAVERIGDLGPMAARGGGSFGPGKPDFDDYARFQRWERGCKCFKPVTPFRRVDH